LVVQHLLQFHPNFIHIGNKEINNKLRRKRRRRK
jgi:hypothetical protein